MEKLTELIEKFREAKSLEERVEYAEKLIKEIGPELQAFALYCCKGKWEIAEEISQETQIVIARNLKQYRGGTDLEFRSWCFTTLRRKLINYLRKEKPERFEPLDASEIWHIIEAGDAGLPPGVRHDLEYAVRLIASLDPACATLLWLHHILDWDIKLIAETTERTYDAVRVQLRRCLEFGEGLMEKHP